MSKPTEGGFIQVWECEHLQYVVEKTSPVAEEMWGKNHARIESHQHGEHCEPEITDIDPEDIAELV